MSEVGATRTEGISITLRLPDTMAATSAARVVAMDLHGETLGDLMDLLARDVEGYDPRDDLYNFAVNGSMILHGERATRLADGDQVELLVAFSGG